MRRGYTGVSTINRRRLRDTLNASQFCTYYKRKITLQHYFGTFHEDRTGVLAFRRLEDTAYRPSLSHNQLHIVLEWRQLASVPAAALNPLKPRTSATKAASYHTNRRASGRCAIVDERENFKPNCTSESSEYIVERKSDTDSAIGKTTTISPSW